MVDSLLDIANLSVSLPVGGELRPIVQDVSFSIREGQALAVVGESGAGKSMTGRAVARLLPVGAVVSGRVLVGGRDVFAMGKRDLRAYRTDQLGVIFQDPRSAINPVRRIGDFLVEALVVNRGRTKSQAGSDVMELLRQVGIRDAERRMNQYPHELSGGLLQRVMIASVLAMRPHLVIADEPTTALDVTSQADVMAILKELQQEFGLALLLVTHDLELAAAVCDETVVMYGGTVMERRISASIHNSPRHPYSAALVTSRPEGNRAVNGKLPVIEGTPISAYEAPEGCVFSGRCSYREVECERARPVLVPDGDGWVACTRVDELAGAVWPTTLGGRS